MDEFIETLFSLENPNQIIPQIKLSIEEKGESLLKLRDSSGNNLIHNLCLSLMDNQDDLFEDILEFLLGSAIDTEEKVEIQSCMNFLAGLPGGFENQSEVLSTLGLTEPVKYHIQIVDINSSNAFKQTPLHLLAGQKKERIMLKLIKICLEKESDVQKLNLAAKNSQKQTFLDVLVQKEALGIYEKVVNLYLDMTTTHHDEMREKVFGYLGHVFQSQMAEEAHKGFTEWFWEMQETEEDIQIGRQSMEVEKLFASSLRPFYEVLSRKVNALFNINKSKAEIIRINALFNINQLKAEYKNEPTTRYQEWADMLLDHDMVRVFGIRTFLFDSELKTNVLTQLATKERSKEFFEVLNLLKQIAKKYHLLLREILNQEAADGSTVFFKILKNFNFDEIQQLLQDFGLSTIEIYRNQKTNQNLIHHVCQNSQLVAAQGYTSIIQELLKIDEEMLTEFDSEGNLPLNYLIQYLKHDTPQQVIGGVVSLLRQCNVTHLFNADTMRTKYNDWVEKSKGLNDLTHIRKKSERYLGKDKLSIKHTNLGDTIPKSKRIAQIKLIKSYNDIVLLKLPVSPLECAIRIGNIDLVKTLVEEFQLSPYMFSLDGNSYIIEIAAQLEDLSIFKYLASKVTDQTEVVGSKVLEMLMRLFKTLSEHETNMGKDFEKFIWTLYATIVQALLRNDPILSKEEDLANEERKPLKSQVKDFGKQTGTEKYSSYIHVMLQCSLDQNWVLFKKIEDQLKIEDPQDQMYLKYRFLKDQCYRNNREGIKTVLKFYPDLIEIINNSDSMKKRISKAMFIKFKDIKDTDLLEMFQQEYKITLIPKIDEFKFGKKRELDQRFKKLSLIQQKELASEQQAFAFKFIINLLKNKHSLTELEDIAKVLLESKSKHQYLVQLLKQGVFFTMIDIQQEVHQKNLYQLLNTVAKNGELQFLLDIVTQLKAYIKDKCSCYPLNFFAEISQFERNYPYREFKFNNFIRKVNHSKDEYPIYLGRQDKGDIDDDTETQLLEQWDTMISQESSVSVSNEKGEADVLVPNGHAILFTTFVQQPPIQLAISQENQHIVENLFKTALELGGFPILEISNLNNAPGVQNRLLLVSFNNLIKKFNQSLKQKNLQTVLHQISLESQPDIPTLKAICDSHSLQHQNFNSLDSKGRTPLSLAIQNKSMTFLEVALSNSKSLFIEQTLQFQSIIKEYFNNSTFKEQFALLKILAQNIKQTSEKIKTKILQDSNDQIYDFIDLGYIAEGNPEHPSLEDNRMIQLLGINSFILKDHAKLLIESYKIQRNVLKSIGDQLKDRHLFIMFFLQMSPTFKLGHFIHLLGCELTLDQVKELETLGYNFSNSICPNFDVHKTFKGKVMKLSPFFPFKMPEYNLSYTLKYVFLKQPQNTDLINYLISKMDDGVWKALKFEVMILVGKILGTKNNHFKRFFSQEKAYLMGRLLTVEQRLKTHKESYMPSITSQFYLEDGYKKMLGELVDILIVNGEEQMLDQLMTDQSKFFLCKELIQNGLQSCCRSIKPRMFLKIAVYGLDQEIAIIDIANIMPDPNAKCTLQDIEEIAILGRCLSKLNFETMVNKVSLKQLKCQLTRELFDEFVMLLISSNTLRLVVNWNQEERFEYSEENSLKNLFIKCSPKTIEVLVPAILGKKYFKTQQVFVIVGRNRGELQRYY